MTDSSTSVRRDKAFWEGRRVVVVGAGLSGIGAAHLLLGCGARVTLTDARPAAELTDVDELTARGITVIGGGHPGELWHDADAVVLSPGIRPQAEVTVAARQAGVDIVAEIELTGDLVEAPIIAITGSNGKSTVTSMVGTILAAAGLAAPVCGNIGTALSTAAYAEVVDGTRPDAYVVEVSSFQAHGIEHFRPRWAALLNIQPDHIDWHGSLAAYADAKLRLVTNMGAGDAIVYNSDDAEVLQRVPHNGAELVAFASTSRGIEAPAAWVDAGKIWWWPRGGDPHAVIAVDELSVIGPHNHANACAATALAALFGVERRAIAGGLTAYRALEHRMEPCGEVGGVRYVNDSKATNVDATMAALEGFDAGVWLILGGRDKAADFGQLLPLLDQRIAGVLLIGEASEAIAKALEPRHEVQRCETLERAVDLALAGASAGDTLLLSPACTSFDQYPNFEERGRHFKRLVAGRASSRSDTPERLMEAP